MIAKRIKQNMDKNMDKNMNNGTNVVANYFEMTTKLEIYCKLFLQSLKFL